MVHTGVCDENHKTRYISDTGNIILSEDTKMKKALILAGLMVVALTACGKKEEAAAPAPAAQPAAEAPAKADAAPAATSAAPATSAAEATKK
jgi:hypothetical protein